MKVKSKSKSGMPMRNKPEETIGSLEGEALSCREALSCHSFAGLVL
jgi:hypothetical protein